jgi:hypothetical protein
MKERTLGKQTAGFKEAGMERISINDAVEETLTTVMTAVRGLSGCDAHINNVKDLQVLNDSQSTITVELVLNYRKLHGILRQH